MSGEGTEEEEKGGGEPKGEEREVLLRHTTVRLLPGFHSGVGSDAEQQLLVHCRSAKGVAHVLSKLTEGGVMVRLPPLSVVVLESVAWAKDVSAHDEVFSVSSFSSPFKYDERHLAPGRFATAARKLAATASTAPFLSYRIDLLRSSAADVREVLIEFRAAQDGGALSSERVLRLRPTSTRTLRLSVAVDPTTTALANTALRGAVRWLAALPRVHYLEPVVVGKTARNGAARQTTQAEGAIFRFKPGAGTPRDWRRAGTSLGEDASRVGVDSDYEPLPGEASPGLSRLGLDGTGQIVSVGDTGLDFTVAFFHDENQNASIFRDPFTPFLDENGTYAMDDAGRKAILNLKHRKVAGYWALMDSSDYSGGHGTHVSGTVLGDAKPACATVSDGVCSLARFNGMAPAAKLLFADLQCNAQNGCPCVDRPGGTEFEWCPCYEFPDGKCPHNGYLYPPDNLGEGYLLPLYHLGARINTNSWGSGCATGGWCSENVGDIDRFIYEHDDMLVLFAAGNDGDDNGFSSLDSQGYEKNGLTIGASRSTSTSIQQIVSGRGSLRKPYATIAVCKEEREACMPAPCSCPPHVIQNCSTECESGCSESCWQSQFVKEAKTFVEVDQDMAYFSSLGPTSGGRWKPDLVAPGFYLASAHSHAGEQPFRKETFCGGGSYLTGSHASWESPPLANVESTAFMTAGNSSEGKHNNTLLLLNQLSVATTHSLSALSFDLALSLPPESFCIVTALVLESAEVLDYSWAPLANASLRLSAGILDSSQKGSSSMQKFTISLRRNVTLWANQEYLVGYQIDLVDPSKERNATIQYRSRATDALDRELLNANNESASCFGSWSKSYLRASSNEEILCQDLDTETSGSMDLSWFPLRMQLGISARDALRNNLQVMAGTSMATPVVAGDAAVVRQYYEQGFFVNASETLSTLVIELKRAAQHGIVECDRFGCCKSDQMTPRIHESLEDGCPPAPHAGGGVMNFLNSGGSAGINPSASLVKATLISGAAPLAGSICTEAGMIELLKGHENIEGQQGSTSVCGGLRDHAYEGFGRISLADSLAIAGGVHLDAANDTTSALRLEVPGLSISFSPKGNNSVARLPFVVEAEEHSYCFELPELSPSQLGTDTLISDDHIPISATLTWTDPPASPSAQQYLCNNLDLFLDEFGGDYEHLSSSYGGYSGSLWRPGEGRTFLGNNDPEAWPFHFPDTKNNAEKIRLWRNTSIARARLTMTSEAPLYSPLLQGSMFRVRVRGSQVAFGPQSYALVVTGAMVKPMICPSTTTTPEGANYALTGIGPFAVVLALTLLISVAVILCWVSFKGWVMGDEVRPLDGYRVGTHSTGEGQRPPREALRRVRAEGYGLAAEVDIDHNITNPMRRPEDSSAAPGDVEAEGAGERRKDQAMHN